ncbi:MAG: GntR family transcriptional regulator [Bauldia sp.]|nr:GntR family transcriptional regulator [Bauldia sp.]
MLLRRETLGGQVYDLLRDRILRGEIAGGTRLAQAPLSEELGTSRIPVRDALKRLENDGLIVGDDVGRYTVLEFTAADAEEIYAIRNRLECLAIERAVQSMTAEQLAEIEALFADLDKAAAGHDIGAFTDLNVDFHMAIYEASGMPRLVRLIRGLWHGVPPLTPIVLAGRIDRSQHEHGEIIDSLRRRDPAGAAHALAQHIETAGEELRESIEHQKQEPTGGK